MNLEKRSHLTAFLKGKNPKGLEPGYLDVAAETLNARVLPIAPPLKALY
jgi:hypothetical protein